MKTSELAGTILGYPLGILTGTLSFLRASRMFHPRGILVRGTVKSLAPEIIKLHPNVMVRFTSALWKNKVWPDVLGLTLRFSEEKQFGTTPIEGDQDLLLASFAHPWQTPIGPFLTNFRDFFQNKYYAVSPFHLKNQKVIFRITLAPVFDGKRSVIVEKNIMAHSGIKLWLKEGTSEWIPIADITLQEELHLNQELLRFNPFLDGLGIEPIGFVHHLRIGAYRFSQAGRGLRYSIQEMLHHLHDRFIVHRL